tara:strand:+ start:385 stop:1443 length:1059 start_codon:yes stop_codon:yes gene_type:complete
MFNQNFNYENIIYYKRCNLKPIKGITKKIFENFNIKKNNDKWDLYIPCGYNNVQKEMHTIQVTNTYQKIYAIEKCDYIASKNNLWMLLEKEFNRNDASKIMPETFVLNNFSHINLLKKKYFESNLGNNYFILKKNIQKKKGILITNDYNIISSSLNENYKVAQLFINNSFIINKRKLNLRIYCLITMLSNNLNTYFNDIGKCLYTEKDISFDNSMNFNEHITNSYKTDEDIYKINPLTLDDFKNYLRNNNFNLNIFEQNLIDLYKKLNIVFSKYLIYSEILRNNLKFQLFGMDLLVDEKLNIYLLEINKGPDMIPKNQIDEQLKTKIQIDLFEKVNLINIENTNYVNNFKSY